MMCLDTYITETVAKDEVRMYYCQLGEKVTTICQSGGCFIVYHVSLGTNVPYYDSITIKCL